MNTHEHTNCALSTTLLAENQSGVRRYTMAQAAGVRMTLSDSARARSKGLVHRAAFNTPRKVYARCDWVM